MKDPPVSIVQYSTDPSSFPEASSIPRARASLVIAIAALAAWAFWYLGLRPSSLVPSTASLELTLEFFSRALSPALAHEALDLPTGVSPLLLIALRAAGNTVVFASAAMTLALPLALLLGFFSTTAWWAQDPVGGRSSPGRFLGRTVEPLIYGGTRFLIALMRSVHELLWAVLFLAAFGLLYINAVIALAIPFAGVLAKIFSEIIDETPRDTAYALRGAGASPSQVFLFALLPRALPDMTAYTFYRFECALRSSAVLGFFGFPTLGFYLAASFENLYYGEVWTYLYTLFVLIVVVEWWSGIIRRWFTS